MRLTKRGKIFAAVFDEEQGTLDGIGAYIRIADGKAYIDKLFKDSPAIQAGIRQNDQIVRVDGVDIEPLIAGLDVNQAAVKVAARIRGPQGTTVMLTLRRCHEESSRT